jgi:hypothetical protein
MHALWHDGLLSEIARFKPIVRRHRREPSSLQLLNISIAVSAARKIGLASLKRAAS